MEHMNHINTLKEIENLLIDNLESLRKFKYEMYTKFNNSNEKKQAEILKNINNKYDEMYDIFGMITDRYNAIEYLISDNVEIKSKILSRTFEFLTEMTEMK